MNAKLGDGISAMKMKSSIWINGFVLFFLISTAGVCRASSQLSSMVLNGSTPEQQSKNIKIGIERENFTLIPSPENQGQKQLQPTSVSAELNYSSAAPVWNWGVDLKGKWVINQSELSHVNALELYGLASMNDDHHLYFGRKKFHWSLLDEYWNLGLWQPRDRPDYLRPDQAGLVGLSYEGKSGNFKWIVTASPLFIPDLGPQFSEKNGKIVSASPWFLNPSSQLVAFKDQRKDISYQLKKPSVKEILFNPGVSSQIKWEGSRSFLQLGYAYKPMNQVMLSYDGFLNAESVAEVNLEARIAYHHIGTAEVGYGHNGQSIIASVLSELPDREDLNPLYTHQKTGRSTTLGLTAYQDISSWRLFGETDSQISIGYIKTFGGESYDEGELAHPGKSSFEPRFFFREALLFTYQNFYQLSRLNQFKTKFATTYDLVNRDSIFSLDLGFYLNHQWEFILGGDILTTWGEPAVINPNSFASRYQSNDRVRLGVSYAF